MWVGGRDYFLVCFLDEYSRYIVRHELLWGIDGGSVELGGPGGLGAAAAGRRGEAVGEAGTSVRTTGVATYLGSLERCSTSTSSAIGGSSRIALRRTD